MKFIIFILLLLNRENGVVVCIVFFNRRYYIYTHIPPDTSETERYLGVMNYYVLRRETPTEFNKTVKLSADRK